MKMLRLCLAASMVALACSTLALAQTAPAPDPTTVSVPWGDMISNARDAAIVVVIAGLGWAARKLPASVLQMMRTMQVEQLLERAITYGINATADAVKGQTLKVDTGNKVVASALQYIVDRAPAWLQAWLGGDSKIKEMIIARIDVEAAAKVVKPSAAAGPTLVAPPK